VFGIVVHHTAEERNMSSPRIERILITNDDGIDAPGLEVLEAVARELADEVWIVAPEQDQSGISHALSIHHPLRVKARGERRFSVSGTPADCVAIGLRELMDKPPQLLLSGINKGANLGVETMFSGTVGAAMAGLLLGVPSIALSQFFTRRDAVKWDTARALAPDVIRAVIGMEWAADVCLNINFPDRHERPDFDDSETFVVTHGGVSVTPLRFERTDLEVMSRLKDTLAN
jgi:5'-nucleotidase